jgi:hypothetical protein
MHYWAADSSGTSWDEREGWEHSTNCGVERNTVCLAKLGIEYYNTRPGNNGANLTIFTHSGGGRHMFLALRRMYENHQFDATNLGSIPGKPMGRWFGRWIAYDSMLMKHDLEEIRYWETFGNPSDRPKVELYINNGDDSFGAATSVLSGIVGIVPGGTTEIHGPLGGQLSFCKDTPGPWTTWDNATNKRPTTQPGITCISLTRGTLRADPYNPFSPIIYAGHDIFAGDLGLQRTDSNEFGVNMRPTLHQAF